jgi:hypothetical protein
MQHSSLHKQPHPLPLPPPASLGWSPAGERACCWLLLLQMRTDCAYSQRCLLPAAAVCPAAGEQGPGGLVVVQSLVLEWRMAARLLADHTCTAAPILRRRRSMTHMLT